MIQDAGSQLVTADAAIGAAGTAVRVFSMHIISGGTAGIVSLLNGSSGSGTAYVKETGTVGTGQTFFYGTQGVLFPSGCWVDIDANTTSALIVFNYA